MFAKSIKFLKSTAWTIGSLALLIGMAAVSFWAVTTLPAPTTEAIMKADLQTQAELWRKRVLLQIDRGHESFRSGTLSVQDMEFLALIPSASDVYRFKLFTADGRVFWSTRPEDIGNVIESDFFFTTVRSGEIYQTFEEIAPTEIDGLSLHSLDSSSSRMHAVYEAYTPVMVNGEFLGAIEFYSDTTAQRDTMLARIRIGLTLVSGALMVFLTLVTLVALRANRSQLRSMRVRNQEERQMMENQIRLAREVKLLGELNEWLQSSHSLDELFVMVVRFLTHLLPDCEGAIYVYSNSRDVLDGVVSWNGGAHKDHIHPEACWGLRRGRLYSYGQSEVDFVCEHAEPHDSRPYYCFPILAHGETVGLMNIKKRPTSQNEDFFASRKLAQMCAEQISMAIANVRMRDQLQDQSIRDPLTGLYNRRHMMESLRKMIARCDVRDQSLTLAYIDVDHFKKFNDNHGHDAGDIVLREVADELLKACDGDEVACRMGGEEFAILWPDVDSADAFHRAEKLRIAIENLTVRYGEKTLPKITMSIGLAQHNGQTQLPQDLLKLADEALYHAKDTGRNRVEIAGQLDERTLGPALQTVTTGADVQHLSAKTADSP